MKISFLENYLLVNLAAVSTAWFFLNISWEISFVIGFAILITDLLVGFKHDWFEKNYNIFSKKEPD